MADEQADSSSVSRVGRILDSIDSFSKNFEYSDEPQNLILENNRTIEDKIPESVNDEAEQEKMFFPNCSHHHMHLIFVLSEETRKQFQQVP